MRESGTFLPQNFTNDKGWEDRDIMPRKTHEPEMDILFVCSASSVLQTNMNPVPYLLCPVNSC